MKQNITDNPISKMRRNYTRDGILEEDVDKNATMQFSKWFTETKNSKILEPNAMTLATSDKSGLATARNVLFESEFIFLNFESRNGKQCASGRFQN